MNLFLNPRSVYGLLVVAVGCWLTSCGPALKIDPQQSLLSGKPPKANQPVNAWILENMKDLYYWNDQIPAAPDTSLDPKPFFYSLLYKYKQADGDRFSWIQENAQELISSLNGEEKTTGMQFKLYLRSEGSNEAIAQVLYVLPNSPAASAGVKRGDLIYKVNGQRLTRSNAGSLLYDATSFVFGLAKVENNEVVDTDETKNASAVVLQENPVYLDSIYVRAGKTIGYLVYNQFIPGPNGGTNQEYDRKLEEVFSKFKARGVNELILDLRYNPGGYVSSSVNLASLIGKGIDNTKTYYRMEYNKTIMEEVQKQNKSDQLITRFQNKANNIGANLQRVFILTTGNTASASELIINGLRPFMVVETIGTTTYGKNVGSITVQDKSGKIKWGMQPIVFKSFNSLGQSDYSAGFKPTIERKEPLTLKPLGDVTEAYLSEALFQITGERTLRRGDLSEQSRESFGSSLERKAGGSSMFSSQLNLKL